MNRIPLVRAVHLNIYLAELRRIGAPVDRAIERAGLPATIEETPDAYLLVPRVLDCASSCGGSHAAMHIGFRAARHMTLGNLRPECQRAFLNAVSGRARLDVLVQLAVFEDGALSSRIVEEGTNLRVLCDLAPFRDTPALAYSEWVQIYAVIAAVRSVAGENWCPEEITFAARDTPPLAALTDLPNTRILLGRRNCSVLVPIDVLARPCRASAPGASAEAVDRIRVEPESWSFVTLLREMVKPYISGAPPDLAEAAEMIGTTARTLQRRLERNGATFKQVLVDARYEIACELLADRSMKIIDVAFAAGYEHPQHFSRAFRRIGGLTPRAFRAGLAAGSPAMPVCQPARTTRSQDGEHSRPIA